MAIAAGFGLWLGLKNEQPREPQWQSMLAYGTPRGLTDFSLATADGGVIDRTSLQGRYSVLFFGFLNCPDVCPTTMVTLSQVDKLLADVPEMDRPNLLFVSVDPARDSTEAIAAYVQHFSPHILGATAAIDVLEPFAKQMGVLFLTQPEPSGGYSVDHSAHFVVLDPQVRIIGIMRPPHEAQAIAADLRELAGSR